MTRLHTLNQQDSCGGVSPTGVAEQSALSEHALTDSAPNKERGIVPQENPLSPRAIAERFDIESEVKAILRQTVDVYRKFHPEEGQKQLSEILSKNGVPEVWAEGE